ncbi:MAG: hypothetical protein UX87_C0044G0009 [Candidatus Amesbacteria bacterium GW2011_GWA1_47_16]|uniref:Uncharacterized protein n=4 Tax=Candidatus Amesiibacteriota TaxID=1752730 RepID=A0A0G1S1F4_9BACT|nr:MAG: hypothetical protein UX87_C0044G0009 [Candidatus Amesbacteria bacterium GW2011_GWA1_47_16]KKU63147.1 MAG: hypothetical protein UX86_C0032G0010 [Candidatus Amesbacteria bacterium GW2011_GWC1_47_15]KKU97201.1 MAG: hypothetical protein UY28_C0026G0010 [Candidatus Amesbacteria bacterium GW2011_GWB1_48_13]OGC98857.1 MAG: hypothetical protein A2701_00755 [Candidatus Amesbacteria bacterium RIFCSPHIGHO2_01_FULL_47_34]OGD00649.1 MAG: hypothetical protein A2972_04250 [Candidatus Amesbacteria bact
MISSPLAQIVNPVLNRKIGNILVQNSTNALQIFLRNIINFALGAAGIYFFANLLRGGYEYITSGGDKESVQKAQKRLTNAFTGIIVIFSIFALLYIVETIFGLSIRTFNIPRP